MRTVLIWKGPGMMRNLMAMYEQYEAFDELEEQFMDMEESVTARVAEYVDNHIEEFAEIV